MTIETYNYIPELNYWFNKYATTSLDISLQNEVPVPNIDSTSLISNNSFFRLLFDNTFVPDSTGSIIYTFINKNLNLSNPSIFRRIGYIGSAVRSYVTDSTGPVDLYNLNDSTNETRILLDKLTEYRMGSTITIDDITYASLSENLSKLIFNYLNLMTNGIYTEFDSVTTISDSDSILENMYELYVNNEAHALISLWKKFATSSSIELRPQRVVQTVDSDFLLSKIITITEYLPHDTNEIYIYKNGDILTEDAYTISSDSTSTLIDLDTSGLTGSNLSLYDSIVIDYYTSLDDDSIYGDRS